jgi:ABC-type multidrug transport system ATPase subunit
MYFYIKEWPNKTATLMSDHGTVLWTFHNVEEAQEVCREWYRVQEGEIRYYLEAENFDPAGTNCAVA